MSARHFRQCADRHARTCKPQEFVAAFRVLRELLLGTMPIQEALFELLLLSP
jgi:hypothetical protein